jgi:DNA-binding response OmpR family regulator
MRIVTNSETVGRYLTGHHEVFPAESEDITTDWYDPEQFDIIVVDIDTTQGAYTPRAIRKENENIPIIGVSEDLPYGGEWPEQRAIFIEQGGSYLLQAPVNPREILACIAALDRRLAHVVKDVRLCNGRLVLKPELMRVVFDEQEVTFTAHETRVLMALAKHHGKNLSRVDLGKILYSVNFEEHESNTIEVFIARIRKRLHSLLPGLGTCVKTVRGFGYRLDEPQLA